MLLLAMLFCLAACGETDDEKKDPPRDVEAEEAPGLTRPDTPEEVLIAPRP